MKVLLILLYDLILINFMMDYFKTEENKISD